ncbi:uncharacterized protein LOC144593137 [Rhinoraja longicauda]
MIATSLQRASFGNTKQTDTDPGFTFDRFKENAPHTMGKQTTSETLFCHQLLTRHSTAALIHGEHSHSAPNIVDTTLVGRISNNDKTEYRKVIESFEVWCQDNNPHLQYQPNNGAGH